MKEVLYEIESPFYNVYRYVIRINFFVGSKLVKVESKGCTSQKDIVKHEKEIEEGIITRIDKILNENYD